MRHLPSALVEALGEATLHTSVRSAQERPTTGTDNSVLVGTLGLDRTSRTGHSGLCDTSAPLRRFAGDARVVYGFRAMPA